MDEYLELINSPRVSPQTRSALLERLEPHDSAYQSKALTADEFVTLRSVLARVIPQDPNDGVEINLPERLDSQLAEAKGDGWRYATLPADADAYRAGLALLDEFAHRLSTVPYSHLPQAAQESLLEAIASGRLHSAKFDLRRWFEDVLAHATQIYVSHPQTLARIGYSGIADDAGGFVQIGIGQREAWEPEPQ